MTSLGSQVINGVACQISVSPDGMFTITRDGNHIANAWALQQAINAASSKISQTKIRVEVEFYTLRGKQGIATGIHAGTGKVLTKIGAKNEQLDSYTEVLKGSTPAEVRERLVEIQTEMDRLKKESFTIKHEYGMKIGKAVKAAIQEATSE